MPIPRIAILHQGCIPVYRRAFYDRLARVQGREYVVVYGDPEPNSGILAAEPPFAFSSIHVRNRYLSLFGRSVAFQSAVSPVLNGDFSALVVGHEIKYIASDLLLLFFRLMGKPVLLWGHGQTNDYFRSKRSLPGRVLGRMVEWVKSCMIRMASGYMAYTDRGAEYVAKIGMPRDRISVLWNTLDVSEVIAAAYGAETLDRAALRRELGIAEGAIVLLFIGRLYGPKKVDVLIDVAKQLRETYGLPVELVVVGSGPDEAALKARCADASWCKFLGPIFDPKPLSRIFRVADTVVLPGKVGLVINHSFAFGLPVITCRQDVQPPEIEYLTDGVNGLILEGSVGLLEGLRHFAISEDLRNRLTRGAIETRQKLDLQHMVDQFDAAVARVLPQTSMGDRVERRRLAP